MSDFKEAMMLAFDDELEKVAVPAVLRSLGQRALGGGSGAALGATAGAGVGGLAGGVHGYRKAKQQGGSGLYGALAGGMRGALMGGGIGAAGGGAAGALSGKRGIQHARQMAKAEGPIGAISRFGQRQVHSLTGALPGGFKSRSGAVRSLRAGGYDIEKRLAETGKKLRKAKGPARTKLQGERASLLKARGHARTAENLGMTSIPGFFRAVASGKGGKGLKAAVGQQWHGSPGVGGKAMQFGLPAAFVASEAMGKGEPGGPGKLSRGLRSAAETAPWMLTSMPLAGATALGSGLVAGGSAMKRLLRRKKPEDAPYPEEADEGQAAPVERVESPGAQGKLPEGLGA
jgi:hypothetical protein